MKETSGVEKNNSQKLLYEIFGTDDEQAIRQRLNLMHEIVDVFKYVGNEKNKPLSFRGGISLIKKLENISNEKVITCKYCQKQYVRLYGDHRSEYCSVLCRKKDTAKKLNKNMDGEYTLPEKLENCVICGISLENKRIGAKTCSPKCRMALYQREKKGN